MPTETINLSASNIKYLLALNRLSEKEEGIRCIEISDILKVSKPSVHEMMKNMKSMELVNKSKYGTVFMTSKGKSLASLYGNYYYIINSYFRKVLKSDERVADMVATSIVSEISMEQLEIICNSMKCEI